MVNGEIYVDYRLQIWQAWRLRKQDHGLGYPRHSAFTKPAGSSFWTPEMESDSYDMDKCVVALRSELKAAVMQCYTRTGTQEQKAKALGVSVRTYHYRLGDAKRQLLGYLNDLAAGVALPQEASGEKSDVEEKLIATA